MIRPLLMWVGEEDIALSIDSVSEEDSEGAALEAFANSLRKALPPDGSRLTLMDVMKLFNGNADLRPSFAGCVAGEREPNHRTLSDLLRRCEHKIFLSDNPGDKFTINKKRDAHRNTFVWGAEYVS